MTIVLICIVVAVGLALVGGYLLLSGQREERGEAMAAAPAQYRPPGPVPPRVRVRGRDEAHPTAQPTQAHPAPTSDERPLPAPATPAATAAPAPDVPARPPAPVASRPTDGAVRAAGHARLEAALARARARLNDAPDTAER
jgi:hypothetical protein